MKLKQIISAALSGVMLLSAVTANAVTTSLSTASADEAQTLEDTDSINADVQNNIINGGFEIPQKTAAYNQVKMADVDGWNTTATDGIIEIFRENTGTYITGVKLTPAEGSQGTELNANQASTLYQYIDTSSGSLYEWGLQHRGRMGDDIMALVIGPKQEYDPKKPNNNKSLKDQFMTMIDWLKENSTEEISSKINNQETNGKPVQVVVYSMPFADNGGFQGEGLTNFSLEQTNVYTEEWHIWIIKSDNQEWHKYGKAAATTDEGNSYYKYTVPEGSEESVFAFVAYEGVDQAGASAEKHNTYGNLLDDITFDLYHPSSTTSNTGGTGTVTYTLNGNESTTTLSEGIIFSDFVDDNSTLTITATPGFAKDENGNDRIGVDGKKIQNHFVGAYITINGEKQYIKNDGTNFTITEDENGYKTYTYSVDGVSGRVIVDLFFTEVYTVTFLSNGGAEYDVAAKGERNPADSFSYFDTSKNVVRYIKDRKASYTTDACNWSTSDDGITFYGWELLNYSDENGNPVIFDDSTVIDYAYDGDDQINFNIYDGKGNSVTTIKAEDGAVFLARWQFKQTVYAQTEINGNYVNSTKGGNVTVVETDDVQDLKNTEDNCGKQYYSFMNKQVQVTATPNENYEFVGWYDSAEADAKMITPNRTHTCDITDTSTTIYARFKYNYYEVRFHINDEDTKSASDDVFRIYYNVDPDPDNETADENLNYLNNDYTISSFYDIPTTTKDREKTYKVFKGWYLDKGNDADSRPIKWNSTKFTSSTDVYAHWIPIETVAKDSIDEKIIGSDTYKTFDLFGTQIRNADEDPNFPDGTPGYSNSGLRFVTSLGETLLSSIDNLNTAKPEYGYVIAKETTAVSKSGGNTEYMLEYKDKNVNGKDTTSDYSYVQNVNCTSRNTFTTGVVPLDHFNCDNYRIYSLVISYESGTAEQIAAAKNSNIIARSYIRYTDANNLLRTYYNDYSGNANKFGGCSTSFNTVKQYIAENYQQTKK